MIGGVKVIAHKGGRYWAGKNFSYIQESLGLGADIIELDVKLSGSEILVKHPLGIPGYDYQTFFPCQGRLKDALSALDSRASLYLDLKDRKLDPERLLDFVKRYHFSEVIVGSFDTKILKKFRQLDPRIVINLHCWPNPGCIKIAKKVEADWINPVPVFLKEKLARQIVREGFKFVPAGVENYGKTANFIKWGAHAISLYDLGSFRKFNKD